MEIPEGRGDQRPGKFQREGGLDDRFTCSFQRSFNSNYTDLSVDVAVQKSFLAY